jgi:hypothetical protein
MKMMDKMLLRNTEEWAVTRGIKKVRDAIGNREVEQELIADKTQRDIQVIH